MSLYSNILERKDAIAVIGLGYVGLPLAVEFSKYVNTIGFDISQEKIAAYKNGIDPTGELSPQEMEASAVNYTADPAQLAAAKFHIIAVPTPITKENVPDLSYVSSACKVLGPHLAKGSIVVCESTVYPGATEEICIPILEKLSNLTCGTDFKIGYSPERINPGDKVNTIAKIVKVVSGMDPESLEEIANIYRIAIKAGVHPVTSIKAAEAVKVVENTQRDVNIAFMNEVAMMFDAMGIDTFEVVAAMNTKWNALGFTPGLVGGHCISVDPHYLMAEVGRIRQQSRIIREARVLNDIMPSFVVEKIVRQLVLAGKASAQAKIAVLGLTFKEDTADIRNSKVVELIGKLQTYGINPIVSDPLADPDEVKREYDLALTPFEQLKDLDCVIVAVPHKVYRSLGFEAIEGLLTPQGDSSTKVIVDIRAMLDKNKIEQKGYRYWRL